MIKKLIIGIILNAAALYGVMYFLPEIKYTGGIAFFAIGGLVMGFLNTIVKPVLKLLTLPIHIITVGLSLIILNGFIFWIFKIVIETININQITLQIDSIITYIFAGLIFGIINWLEHLIISNK